MMLDPIHTQNQRQDLEPHTITQVCVFLPLSLPFNLFILVYRNSQHYSCFSVGMFLSMSMEEPNEPLACNVDGGRRGGAGSSRSNDDDSSVSMPESGSSAGSEHGGNDGMNAPPNGHMAGGILPDLPLHPPMLGASQLKRRPVSPADDPRRPPKRPKHGTSTMLLSLMQVGVEQVTTVRHAQLSRLLLLIVQSVD